MTHRIDSKIGDNIRFEYDPFTKETIMFVCEQPYKRKKVPANMRIIAEAFKKELKEKSGFICPTDLDTK